MNWFLVAIIPPILYATGNYIDKALLSKWIKSGGVGAIVLFSCFLGILTLPIIYFIEPGVFTIEPLVGTIMALNGALTVVAVLCYLHAIEFDEITAVVPILQLSPVFGFFTGYIFLGEMLTALQIFGSAIIVIGAIIISLDISHVGKVIFRKRAVIYAVTSAFIFSLNGAIFKFFALDEGYWRTQFWEYIGIAIIGLVFFYFIPTYRNNFISVIRNNRIAAISLNLLAETVMVSADLIMNFATLLAPVTLVYVVNSFQPVFVLLLGVGFTLLFPKVIKESLMTRQLVQRGLTIFLMVLGLIMLYQ